MGGKLTDTLGITEFKTKRANIWKALIAEFIGNLLLNFFGCGSAVALKGPIQFVLIGLTFGFVIFIIVQTLGHVSGAHVNPAVTAGMLVTQNISILKGILYIIVQCLGALAGSAILMCLTPKSFHESTLGNVSLHKDMSELQGLGVEFFLGFVLVLTVFGVCDPNRHETKAAGALAIGLAVATGHLATVDYTGSGMNPARSFGSAVIANGWESHWIFWVGPILGGIVAALLYKYVFAAPPTGPLKIIERYTAVISDENEPNSIRTIEKELKRLDGSSSKHEINLS